MKANTTGIKSQINIYFDPLLEKELINCWSTFITHLCPWDWFYSLTFEDAIHPEQADKKFRRWIRGINTEMYGRRFREKNKSVPWVRATEFQTRGVVHYHGLIGGGVSKLRRLTWMDYWHHGFPLKHEVKRNYKGVTQIFPGGNGFARIQTYNPKLGAAFYICKYIVKDGEIDISVSDDLVTHLLSWDLK